MRIRYKSWAKKYIEDNPNIFINNYLNNEKIEEHFIKYQTIEMEIGCGKGQFIVQKAKENSKTLFIAVEKVPSIVVLATEKIIENKLDNVLFFCGDILDFKNNQYFENRIDKIYINFSDPWPKKRHQKRRLTNPEFLKIYYQCLKNDGYLEQKTDNDNLFDYSVINIGNYQGLSLETVHVNLHQTDLENIQTEYEQKFAKRGFTIKYILAQKKVNKNEV